MEAVGQPMQPHLDAVLKKQPEPQNTEISLEEFNVWKEKEATGVYHFTDGSRTHASLSHHV